MATVTVAHHPELTLDGLIPVFQRYFAGKYSVSKNTTLFGSTVAVKGRWVAAGVGLKQQPNATAFSVGGNLAPLLLYPLVLLGVAPAVIAYFLLSPQRKQIEDEVGSFIANAPEFK